MSQPTDKDIDVHAPFKLELELELGLAPAPDTRACVVGSPPRHKRVYIYVCFVASKFCMICVVDNSVL